MLKEIVLPEIADSRRRRGRRRPSPGRSRDR